MPVPNPELPSTPSPEELTEHLEFVRGVARSLVGDPDVAEDLSQEAILAALRRPPRLTHDLRSWLGGVVRNLARGHHRERARRARREHVVATERTVRDRTRDGAETALERAELRQRIAQAVLDLEEPYRGVLILRYMENLTPSEIAGQCDRPVATVKTQLQRGLERLRDRFDLEAGSRTRWRRALLALLLPLPLATTVQAEMNWDATESAPAPTTGGPVAASFAAGWFSGALVWVPLVAVLGTATWFALDPLERRAPDPPAEVDTEPPAPPVDAPDELRPTDLSMTPGASDVASPGETALDVPSAPVRTFIVLDEGGRPVVGAALRPLPMTILFSTEAEGVASYRIALKTSLEIVPDPATPGAFERIEDGVVRTDEMGHASLALDPDGATIRVTHPDHLERLLGVDAGSAGDGPVEVILESGVLATIAVTDARTGRGIAGATVRVLRTEVSAVDAEVELDGWHARAGAIEGGELRPPELSGEALAGRIESVGPLEVPSVLTVFENATASAGWLLADARGEVSVRVRAGDPYTLRVRAPDYGEILLTDVDLAEENPLVVPLPAAATLRIVRTGLAGDLPALDFRLEHAHGSRPVNLAEGEHETEVLDLPAGRARLIAGQDPGVDIDRTFSPGDRGELRALQLVVEEWTDGEPFRSHPLELRAGEETLLDLDRRGEASLEVAVTPAEAAEGTRIEVRAGDGTSLAALPRPPFEFTDLPIGAHRLVALRAGEVIGEAPAILVRGANRCELELPEGRLTVTGLAPLQRLEFHPSSADGAVRSAVAGPDGTVAFDFLPEGPATVWLRGIDVLESRTVTIGAREERLEWGRSAGFPAVVRIDGPGRADEAYRVRVAPWGSPPSLPIDILTSRAGRLDLSGRALEEWTVPDVPLRVSIDPEGDPIAQVFPWRPDPRSATALTLREEGVARIRARGADGPLARHALTISTDDPGLRGRFTVRTDRDGRVQVSLPAGRYRISDGMRHHGIGIPAGEIEFELTF